MAWIRSHKKGSGGGNIIGIEHGTLVNDVFIADNNGAEVAYAGWSATDYIDTMGADKLYRTGCFYTADYNAFYDSNKQFISSFRSATSITSVPSGAKYVRFSKNTDMWTNDDRLFIEL